MTSLLLLKSMLFANALQKSKKKKKSKIKKTPKLKKLASLSMCRICNDEPGDIPIFNNFIQPNIPEEIQNFSGITLNNADNLSKHMCQSCLDLLNGCIMFREMCQRTNKLLIEVSIKKGTDGIRNWYDLNFFSRQKGLMHKVTGNNGMRDVCIEEVWQNKYDTYTKQWVILGFHYFNDDTATDSELFTMVSEFTEDCQNDVMVRDTEDAKAESDDYNIPSPEFTMDNSELLSLWGCSNCGEEFHVMATYSRHILKCNTQSTDAPKPPPEEVTKRKFLCDICGKTAYSNASLLVHMAIHENVFPFKCDVCPYQGRTMDLLKVHKRSHLVDKPFKCTQCPKATTTSSNLAKHMRHVHSTTRPFKCTYCDKAFSYQHDMKRHVKDIHLRQGTVECDICHKKFNTKKILQGHRWKIHKIKGERQGRLPSYLQCQVVGPNNENNVIDHTENCDENY